MLLLIRGGSVSAGYGSNKSYPDIIQNKLINKINIVNRSYFKNTSFEAVRTYQEDIYPYKPDLVLLHFGIDDAYHPVYRSEFKENLVQTVRLIKNDFNSEIILITSHSFENPLVMEEVNIYYKAVRETAIDMNCHFIPVHIAWDNIIHENSFSYKDLVQTDDRYPNEAGHKCYADIVMNYLINQSLI